MGKVSCSCCKVLILPVFTAISSPTEQTKHRKHFTNALQQGRKDTTCGKEPGWSLQSSIKSVVYMTSMCGGDGSWNNSANITCRRGRHRIRAQSDVACTILSFAAVATDLKQLHIQESPYYSVKCMFWEKEGATYRGSGNPTLYQYTDRPYFFILTQHQHYASIMLIRSPCNCRNCCSYNMTYCSAIPWSKKSRNHLILLNNKH